LHARKIFFLSCDGEHRQARCCPCTSMDTTTTDRSAIEFSLSGTDVAVLDGKQYSTEPLRRAAYGPSNTSCD
jgi:hypothetical protein